MIRAVSCTLVMAAVAMAQSNPELQVLPVQGSVYLLAGAGGNIAVQAGKEGVLLVDSGLAASASKVIAEVRKLSSAPVFYIVNTHVHPDHVGGNEAFAKAAGTGEVGTIGGRLDGDQPLKIIAHENVLNRMTAPAGKETPPPQLGLPQDEYFTPSKDLPINAEAVVIYHEPNAHTDGDSIVHFRASDVIATGDIFTPGSYPFIDIDRGGSVQGEIAALNHVLDLAVPGKTQEGGTYIIPGHGRICDEADVVEYRDMIVIVRDRVQDMIKKGMTLEQIKAAKPSQDYDTEYVKSNSFVKADQLVESIYKSLTQRK